MPGASLKTVFGLMLLTSCTTAVAEGVFTANKLRQYCADRDAVSDAACTEYIQGFVGGIGAADGSKEKDAKLWCFPKDATVGQARLVVEKYMRENPEILHKSASFITGTALLFAFPCKIQTDTTGSFVGVPPGRHD
jgi:hypothetical protein